MTRSGVFAAVMKHQNERGFMLLSAVFLTLIVSTAAMILMNVQAKVQQRDSTLYLTAINLANEQFAILESRAAENNLTNGSYNFLGESDLKSLNGVKEDSPPVVFDIKTTVSGDDTLKKVKITVNWDIKNTPPIEFEKIIATHKETVNEGD